MKLHNHNRISKTIASDVMIQVSEDHYTPVHIHLNGESFFLIESSNKSDISQLCYGFITHNKNIAEISLHSEEKELEKESTRSHYLKKKETLGEQITLNLGGGALIDIDIFLTERNTLLIRGLSTQKLYYNFFIHSPHLVELQILSI